MALAPSVAGDPVNCTHFGSDQAAQAIVWMLFLNDFWVIFPGTEKW
jgi:hypothetical protein